MSDSIYARKSTVLIVAILTSIVLLGTTIGFIVWFNYDRNYGVGEIVVRNDRDFENRYDFPGTGTSDDPYLIADYNIDTNRDYAIFIDETSKYFLITNCTIKCRRTGIYVLNSASGKTRIENNNIQGNSVLVESLIHIRITEGVQIINNNLSSTTENNDWFGFYMVEAANSLLANNSCLNAGRGVSITDSDSLQIEFNYFDSCYEGINLKYCRNSLIRYNVLFNNQYLGVHLYSCRNSIAHHNNFIGNGYNSYYDSQAYDSEDNLWYDVSLNEGNFWSDLVWNDSATYVIEGYGNSIDLHPLQFPVLI